VNIHGALLVESQARFAFIASFAVLTRIETVDGLCEDAGTGGFAYASRTAEEVGMRKFAALNGVLERRGYGRLSNHGAEGHGAVLACRDDVFRHYLYGKVKRLSLKVGRLEPDGRSLLLLLGAKLHKKIEKAVCNGKNLSTFNNELSTFLYLRGINRKYYKEIRNGYGTTHHILELCPAL